MICPKCGENNSNNFRYCGMCGTPLDPRRAAPAPTSPPPFRNTPESPRPLADETPLPLAAKPVPPISGPSMLGLNTPSTPGLSQASANQLPPRQPVANPDPHPPHSQSFPDRPFSGFDSFLEPDQPKTGARRILLLILLLLALGAAAWWTYGYVTTSESQNQNRGSQTATEVPNTNPSDTSPPARTPDQATPSPSAGSPQTSPTAAVPEGPSENATPNTSQNTSSPQAKPFAPTSTPLKPKATQPKATQSQTLAEKRMPPQTASKAAEPLTTGDADFRRGEAYLYGRGVPENCEEAVKNLKTASAKSNAKARSAFGTMYATGHCVARDLPTSYLWFAMALRVDPNNQILEKDLNAVWNQMTPPERQQATRMKQ